MPESLTEPIQQSSISESKRFGSNWPISLTRLAIIGLAVLTVSGCVYLRLLEFKGQLGHFDENFAVDVEDGLSITFLNPVILQKDMWKIGLPPTIQKKDAEGSTWTHIFQKQYGSAGRAEPNHDVWISLRFVDNKLTRFAVGEELFTFIPKAAVLMTLRSLGELNINFATRKASLNVEEGPGWDFPAPNKDAILGTLGLPFAESHDGDRSTVVYSYKLMPSSPPSDAYDPKKHGLPYRFIIAFDGDDEISSITAAFPFMGSIKIDYEDPVEE